MTCNTDDTSDDPGDSLSAPTSFIQDISTSNSTESPSSFVKVPEPAEQHPCSSAASTDEVVDVTEGSLKVRESLLLGAQSSSHPFPLPDWILEHCVTLRETWEDTPDFLNLLGEDAFDQETGLPTKAEAKMTEAQDLTDLPYVMDEDFFCPLLMLVRPEEDKTPGNPRYFTNDIVHIQSPFLTRLPIYRTRFLTCVVKQFAKTIGADLLLFDSDDVKDFTEDCWDVKDQKEEDFRAAKLFEHVKEGSLGCSSPNHGAPQTQDGDADEQQADLSATRWTEPFATILNASNQTAEPSCLL